MGCIVARREFVEEHPEAVDAFLDLYGDSISFMSDEGNRSEAAELVAKYGIAPNEQVAQAAIPQCNLTFLTGQEMRAALEGYYAVLFRTDPASIGGGMPYDAFYYGGGVKGGPISSAPCCPRPSGWGLGSLPPGWWSFMWRAGGTSCSFPTPSPCWPPWPLW